VAVEPRFIERQRLTGEQRLVTAPAVRRLERSVALTRFVVWQCGQTMCSDSVMDQYPFGYQTEVSLAGFKA